MDGNKKRPRESDYQCNSGDEPNQIRRPPLPTIILGEISEERMGEICAYLTPTVQKTVYNAVQTSFNGSNPLPNVIRGEKTSEERIREICAALTPIVQKPVYDAVQKSLSGTNLLYRNPHYYMENSQPMQLEPRLQFIFTNEVPQQIYTINKITDYLENPLQVKIVDIETGEIYTKDEVYSVKARIVVIDGDLEEEDCDTDKFNSNIVAPRKGKGALLGGETIKTLNQGTGNFDGIYFTDISKGTRCGAFRLGVCEDSGAHCSNGLKVKVGLSKKFVVKDHRGELHKKHYPPSLHDETWRLETIAKKGIYHKRLMDNGIENVEDLLRMWFANSNDLQNNILKMTKKTWQKLINHAIQCPISEDTYLFESEGILIRLSSVGQILEVSIGGTCCSYIDLAPQQMAKVSQLASQAYEQWNQLQRVPIHVPLNELRIAGFGNGEDLTHVPSS